MINVEFKKAEDVAKAIKQFKNIEILLVDNKIYKKAGRRYIKLAESLGTAFCEKTRKLERISFIDSVQKAGCNESIIILK